MKSLDPIKFIKGLKSILDEKTYFPESLQANPVLQVLLRRRTIRKFQEKPIPEEVMKTIIEAGRMAPSAVNLQTWSFGVFDKDTWQEKFNKKIPFNGDRAIIVLGDAHRMREAFEEFPHKPLIEYTLAVMNASIASYAMNIAAEACGIGSVMLSDTGQTGFYEAEYLKEKLELPDGVFPLMTIVFGYPKAHPPGIPPKLPQEEITFSDMYEEPDRKTIKRWIEQMQAGYRATKITESFKGQLKHYIKKCDQSERDLRKLIFHRPEEFKTED